MKNNSVVALSLVVIFLGFNGSNAIAGPGKGGGPDLPAPDYDFRTPSAEKVELGRVLMFDKILSGNENISCGTCHHSLTDTGDGLSLPVGEGGKGLGVTRDTNEGTADEIHERVPRNAPPVFNLGDNAFHTLFHDGRVTVNPAFPSNCETPAGHNLPDTLENVLACQAMFPVTSFTEMRGQAGENDIADATQLHGPGGVWDLLAQRLQGIPEYVDLFKAAFPSGPNKVNNASDITYAHAANAISAFEGVAWRADNSPFDQYLRGDKNAMSENVRKGMELFYEGDSNGHACSECHSGLYQTDLSFHAIAMPQIGAGRGSGPLGTEDFGREMATGNPNDILKFRTPTLRNVALTGPWGHGGAYNTLRAVVEHHLDPVYSLNNYDRQAILPKNDALDPDNYAAMDDPDAVYRIEQANELELFTYTEEEVDRIIDFLHALTDTASLDLRSDQDVVNGVPSALPLDD
ncbi:MAG: cytochrome-c peroxidase [Gammaproteobacteria bacterium]|nr:cytochrome-c peroxidase [Gammaproteobacteria bacterium]